MTVAGIANWPLSTTHC